MRGKIVIFQDFQADGLYGIPWQADLGGTQLDIQDKWDVGTFTNPELGARLQARAPMAAAACLFVFTSYNPPYLHLKLSNLSSHKVAASALLCQVFASTLVDGVASSPSQLFAHCQCRKEVASCEVTA